MHLPTLLMLASRPVVSGWFTAMMISSVFSTVRMPCVVRLLSKKSLPYRAHLVTDFHVKDVRQGWALSKVAVMHRLPLRQGALHAKQSRRVRI